MNPDQTLPPHGDLARTPPQEVLRWCEKVRFTGTLCVTRPEPGELPLVGGAPELHGPEDPTHAVLERFLAATEGTYVLSQKLPPLGKCTELSYLELEGRLEDATMGDLMHYCEVTGLSGHLTVEHLRDGAVETCDARYRRGELDSITLDGSDDEGVNAVFDWREGRWSIVAKPAFTVLEERTSTAPPVPRDALLRTLEVTVAEILERSLRSRTPSYRPPSMHAPGAPPDALPPMPLPGAVSTGPYAVAGIDGGKPPTEAVESTVKIYLVRRKAAPPAEGHAEAPAPERAQEAPPTEGRGSTPTPAPTPAAVVAPAPLDSPPRLSVERSGSLDPAPPRRWSLRASTLEERALLGLLVVCTLASVNVLARLLAQR
ncbi:MAG: hypothetical protein HY909_03470 [Deltaproteobacteria bacterium]|nr:hypothetical protein [Deltaproteobacteria bacterium]